MEPVGKFNHDNPYISSHGQYHFAYVFRLKFFGVIKMYLADFGCTVYDIGSLLAEELLYLR